MVKIYENEAMQVQMNDATGDVWFKTMDGNKGAEAEMGLSRLTVERMAGRKRWKGKRSK